MIQKEFIRNELRYRYPNLSGSIRQPQQAVGRPLLLEGGGRTFGARIVVTTGEEFNALKGAGQSEPLFLCIGTPRAELLRAYDVCVLPQGEQIGAVLNFVQRLFDRLDDWTQSLRQAAETGEGAEELLSRASEMLQNPVLLLDARGHIVAQSALAAAEEFYPNQLSGQAGDAGRVEKELNPNQLSGQTGDAGRVEKVGSGLTPEAMFVRLQAGEGSFTLVCPASERPLYASDEIVLESLAGFLRLMLSERTLRFGARRIRCESEPAARCFQALLRGEGTANASADALRQLGWSDADEYAVLAIEPASHDLRAAQADAICDLLEEKLEGCCAFPFLPVVATVVKASLPQVDSLKKTLRGLADENGLRIGFCEPFAGFSLFSERLDQAKTALNHAEECAGSAGFSDVFESEFSAQLRHDAPKALLCMRSVYALARYDREHGTSYLETARQYVCNRFNAVRTAGELFIHRSTFLYRLERIKAQFGLDLDDTNLSLLHLLYSLQIVKEL